ncbi:FkbM family methyltransferase [Sphingobacterium bambusae]|uniref:FkbM family methyltransferase n=1 Tax=Sphingobacterium bambusae TaxID=662858 RepID=A0ABW6BDT2_9SPHI|nr:FkbM family methyltransferase [Sphingobacterium bambusae]WPL47458.1 FkbM family methyltransferase [Sphingobacterium bambusae]
MIGLKLNILSAKIFILKFKINAIKRFPFFKEQKEKYLFKNHFNLLNRISVFQEKCFQQLFGSSAKGILFDTHNGALISNPLDTEINRSLGFYGQYDMGKINFLKRLVKDDFNIYFLGAHIGTLLIPLSKVVNSVVGFEANPATFEYLKSNLNLNKVSNASIYNLGVYDKQGTTLFYQNKANTGGSKIKPHNDHFIYNYDKPTETMVQTICLDDFVVNTGLPYPDMMIVDIEGAEYAALKMSATCLSHCKYLYIEFVPHHLANVANVHLNDFLSVITPFFNRMILVNSSNDEFKGDDISNVLANLYSRGVCVDLLFFNL